MRCTNRHSNIKKYDACRTCDSNISGYGVCQAGYENFYYRRNKDNGCGQCRPDPRYQRSKFRRKNVLYD